MKSLSNLKRSESQIALASTGVRRHPFGKRHTVGVPLPRLVPRRLARSPETAFLSRGKSAAAETFRRLRTALQNHPDSPRVVAVTSAVPGEGRSVVALNLALALAEEHRAKVLLIDADLRRPALQHWVDPEPQLGLTDILSGRVRADDALLCLQNTRLELLPSGRSVRDPVSALSSPEFCELIKELRARFEWIVIDTPAVLPFNDADAIGAATDGALMVVAAGQTETAVYLEALKSIHSTKVLGSVRNEIRQSMLPGHGDALRFQNEYEGQHGKPWSWLAMRLNHLVPRFLRRNR